jgi:hypothetical protein
MCVHAYIYLCAYPCVCVCVCMCVCMCVCVYVFVSEQVWRWYLETLAELDISSCSRWRLGARV